MHTVLARDLAPEAHGELLMNVLEASTCYTNTCILLQHAHWSGCVIPIHYLCAVLSRSFVSFLRV